MSTSEVLEVHERGLVDPARFMRLDCLAGGQKCAPVTSSQGATM